MTRMKRYFLPVLCAVILAVFGWGLLTITGNRIPGPPKPDLTKDLAISIGVDKARYKQMEPIFLRVTYQNLSPQETELNARIVPRFEVEALGGKLPKTDYARSEEAREDRAFSDWRHYNGSGPLPISLKSGEKFSRVHLLNAWSDLTTVAAKQIDSDSVDRLKIHIQQYGVTSNEIEVMVERQCALRECF